MEGDHPMHSFATTSFNVYQASRQPVYPTSLASPNGTVSSRFQAHTLSSLDLALVSQNPRQAFAWGKADDPGEFIEWGTTRKRVYAVLCRSEFDMSVGIVIIVDALITGIEVDFGEENKTLFSALGQVMLLFFICELALRIYVFRMEFFHSWINNFDFTIVALGVVAVILGDILASNNYAQKGLKSLPVVRISRLLRAIRVVRISTQFRALWMIVSGVKASIGIVLWTTVLLALSCYCFGIVAVEYVAESTQLKELEFDTSGNTVGERFGSLPKAMLSLFEFFAIENVSAKGYDLVIEQPWIMLFLMAFTLVVPIVLLNLITAVLVETAITASARDMEHVRALALEEWRRKVTELEVLFDNLVSGSRPRLTKRGSQASLAGGGQGMGFVDRLPHRLAQHFNKVMSTADSRPQALRLTQEKVESTWESDTEVREHLNLLFGEPAKSERGLKRLLELWSVLDLDGDGVLSMSEFSEGLAILYDILKSNSADAFIMLRLVQLLQDAKTERKVQREELKATNSRLLMLEAKAEDRGQRQMEALQRIEKKLSVIVAGSIEIC